MEKSKREVVLERDNLGWGYHTKVTRIGLCRVKTPLIRVGADIDSSFI